MARQIIPEEQNFNMLVKENIEKIRKHYDYSITEMASVLRIDRTRYYMIRSVDSLRYNFWQVKNVADEFFLTIDDVLTWKD